MNKLKISNYRDWNKRIYHIDVDNVPFSPCDLMPIIDTIKNQTKINVMLFLMNGYQ